MSATALIIDDEVQIRRLLRLALESQNYRLFEAVDGQSGLSEAVFHKPDVILLDLGLPDVDGIEVLKRLREWSTVPVVILSVRDSADDKIAALDAGADDYVQKPFDTRELLARVRAVQRRTQTGEESPSIVVGDLIVDLAAHTVSASDQLVKLTPIEFALVKVLAQHVGKVVIQKHLLREVWGPQAEQQSQYLRVHMTHVRRKLADAGLQKACIKTEAGIGYRLEEVA
jgi:two-component system KDP operon response regulator KdpE